jgi:hypothetical protein
MIHIQRHPSVCGSGNKEDICMEWKVDFRRLSFYTARVCACACM